MKRNMGFIVALLGVSWASPVKAEPVVLELFTSQGCSSCPPAEAYMSELSKDPNILVLSYHVNYWDYLGWKDPFATEANTRRQRTYAALSGKIYTPEVRVNGKTSVVGSNRRAVQQAIATTHTLAKADVLTTPDGWSVTLPSLSSAEAILLRVQDSGETDIMRGENAGRVLRERNMVTHIQNLGPIVDKRIRVPSLSLAPGEHAVLLVQKTGQNAILAAVNLPNN